MEKSYLDISSANDLSSWKERFIYRCFEIIPALLSWGTVFFALIVSWLAPSIAAVFIIIFACYWLFKVLYLAFHQVASYRTMKKVVSTDWLGKVKKEEGWQDIYHLIVLPAYKEDVEIIRSSVRSIFDSCYPNDKIIVVLAIEERAGKETLEAAEKVRQEFKASFFDFLITIHPKNIQGEMTGKGANVAWAIKEAKKVLEKFNLSEEDVVASIFDVDTRPHPQYFAVLTWHYLNADDPLRASYQPIPIYNNNIWQSPAFSRVIATSGTFWQMMQQERPEQLVTYSSHSIPFKVIDEIGYPKNMVSDDSRIFWKSYLAYDGNYKTIPLYCTVSMDAVLADNFFKTALNQYKQQRRWAWGCENIPFLFYGFLKNKKIPLGKKILHIFVILDGFWSWGVAALLIFFMGWLPLMIGGKEFQTSLLSYNLPKTTSSIMTIAMIGMIISATLSLLLLPSRPAGYSRWKNLSMFLQWLLLPVTLILFGSFPSLESQARMAIKKPLGFWVTEKSRKKPF
jgi:cellulose synthase/poly-beta-1,6-N-acetylglucosamine synthase-like glycosyltransferase